ncbi:MAG: hypothetical protein FWE67_07595 [Planctomycetaceae bacterium]|nr:hypothetical protein [Planctomycetaceae bacterium]
MAYVVKEWRASHQPDINGVYVHIGVRRAGIISFLMSLAGIDPTVHLTVTEKNFCLEAGTFWGYFKRTVPIRKISEIRDGFNRAWLAPLFFWGLGVLSFFYTFGLLFSGEILSSLGMLFLTCIFVGIGLYIYVFYRVLSIGVVGSGHFFPVEINFKPSLIEGQSIGAEDAEEVGRIILELMNANPQPYISAHPPTPVPDFSILEGSGLEIIEPVPQVSDNEFERLKMSAATGDSESQYKLGIAYYNGTYNNVLIRKDREEAKKWLRWAAQQGHAKAAHALQRIDTK